MKNYEKNKINEVLLSILGRFFNGKNTYGLLPGEKERIISTLRDRGVSVETIVNDKEQTLSEIKGALGNRKIDYSNIEKLLPELSEIASTYLCICQSPGYLRWSAKHFLKKIVTITIISLAINLSIMDVGASSFFFF